MVNLTKYNEMRKLISISNPELCDPAYKKVVMNELIEFLTQYDENNHNFIQNRFNGLIIKGLDITIKIDCDANSYDYLQFFGQLVRHLYPFVYYDSIKLVFC